MGIPENDIDDKQTAALAEIVTMRQMITMLSNPDQIQRLNQQLIRIQQAILGYGL